MKGVEREMFIDHQYIEGLLEKAKDAHDEDISAILQKARNFKGLTHEEVSALLMTENKEFIDEIFTIAGQIKKAIYGNRIVIFAPLYISDYCINNCTYCGYKRDNNFSRKKLTKEEIQAEVRILESMGHKRMALEVGEDPVNCDIEYVLESIKAIYDVKLENGAIRRINVNIAATTVENYQKLKAANIGTYILFQETYHQPTYEKVHSKSTKGNFEYHLTAFDRAMEGGIDDVGAGVLFGLYDARFEVLGLMLHNEHLEKTFGVGFHTISVPRLRKAEGMDLTQFPHLPDDETFKRMVAIIRLAVPYTGLILSTRESAQTRRELLRHGITQISAGSITGVGGYKEAEHGREKTQFEVSDHRSTLEVVKSLIEDNYIPSFCTACYRQGRTGDRFMQLAKAGTIQHVCQPNALLTLMEYILDYGDNELNEIGTSFIMREVEKIPREDIKKLVLKHLVQLKNGQRDLYF